MVYSVSKGSLFCAICKLFGVDTQFGYEGFNDWKNGNDRIISHENSYEHSKNIVSFVSRQRDSDRIDTDLANQITNEIKYWSAGLNRVVEIIKYLTSRGLTLRGCDEHIGSLHNGNFLGAVELLAKFDPFMSSHIVQYENAGKGIPSYLSKTIYEELIILMHKKITSEILNQIKTAKYYSIIVDSTLDIAHIGQLCFVIRYVLDDGSPVERFWIFFENSGHKSKELAETVFEALSSNNIPIKYCRGQSYDNARNMSGQYSGLQARIKSINPLADYVPCAGYSLNLFGTFSAECCTNSVKFFDMIQKIYNFFSSSTSWWGLLKEHIGNVSVKSLSITRWSARADACYALLLSYSNILEACNLIETNKTETAACKHEVKAIKAIGKYLKSLEFGIMICIWNKILNRFVVNNIFIC